MPEERVILVDEHDRELGEAAKLDVHRGDGELHRAFSILVFDPQHRLLLQQRALSKYHFGGLWSNSCCGHPRPGEGVIEAGERRLGEEFGFSVPLKPIRELVYRADDPVSGLVEHEYLHVLTGTAELDPTPNPDEIMAWRWVDLATLHREIDSGPERFSPWFRLLARDTPELR